MASRSGRVISNILRQGREHNPANSQRRNICRACSIRIAAQRPEWTISLQSQPAHQPSQSRYLSTSSPALKKSSANSKSQRKSPPIPNSSKDTHIPDNKHQRNLDSEPDPYDHSTLQSSIDQALARLKDSLSKTRDAGRVTTQMIEDLPIDMNIKNPAGQGKDSSAHKEHLRLRDVATVVPKGGRSMQVFLTDAAHSKPVTSAIQASEYSLVPQPDAQNPLLLIVPVPPATAETRQQAVVEAKKCFDRASLDVRNARGDAQKVFRKMEKDGVVVPDELRKAHKGMEEVAKKGQDEVKKVFDAAVKTLQNV